MLKCRARNLRQNIKNMKVRNVMARKAVSVSPQTSYEEASRILYGNNLSGAPVVNRRGEIIGIISEKDLFRAMYPRDGEYYADPAAYRDEEGREEDICSICREPVAKFMTKPAVIVHADDPILHAGGILLAHDLHWLPVVDHGSLVGIVTRGGIFRAILQQHLFSLMQKVEKTNAIYS